MNDAKSPVDVCERARQRSDLQNVDELLPVVGASAGHGRTVSRSVLLEASPLGKELHDSWAPFTWVMKGAQLGVTEAAINRALYTLDRLKRDVLYVLPTTTAASDFSKARFGAALENSEYLKSIFTETNAVNIKRAGANTLYIRGSGGRGT